MSAGSASAPLARRARDARRSEIRDLLEQARQPDTISFAGGLPHPDGFPTAALRAAFDHVLAAEPGTALQYGPTEGEPALRSWIAAHESAAGVATDPAQVLVLGGSQQGLDLLGKALIDPATPVAVETPSYLGALQAFAQYEPRWMPLAGDDEGLDPEALATALQGDDPPRLLYLQPRFQNPTGRSLPPARLERIAALARAHGLWLVEDDPYGALGWGAPPPPSLRAFAPEHTIRLGSFSKTVAPGLRLGYAIAPAPLHDALVRLKQASDLHTGTLVQRALARVLAEGLLERHLPAVRARYRTQCEAMLAALAETLPPGCRWNRPTGGLFVWLQLPAGVDAQAMLPAALRAGVAYVPGAAFFAAAPRPATLRLSHATVGPQQIALGVERLAGVIRHALDRGGRP